MAKGVHVVRHALRKSKRVVLATLAAIVCAVTLFGCIPIKDLGEFWDKGEMDPALAGHWKQIGNEFGREDTFYSFIEDAGERVYLFQARSADMPQAEDQVLSQKARTTRLGDYSFIMIRDVGESIAGIDPAPPDEPREVIGELQRYSVSGNVLTLYYLDDNAIHRAIEAGKVKGTLPPQPKDEESIDLTPAMLDVLDEPTVAFIIDLCRDEKNWTRTVQYERVADLDAAIAASRAYPATEQTPANATVNVSQPDLAWFADGRADILRQQLQADPRWRVFREGTDLVVYEREPSGDGWCVNLNGYRTDFGQNNHHAQTRRLFRFADIGGDAFTNPYNIDEFTQAAPDAGDVQLNLRSSNQGIESYLTVGTPGLWFEFFEQTDREPRQLTRDALDDLAHMLAQIRHAADEIKQHGFARALLPEQAIRHGQPSMNIADGFQGGLFDVSAWVNPGASGYVYLRCVRASDQAALSEDELKPKSLEYVGWSTDPNDLFLYNSTITIYEGDWDHPYPARFELWFTPDDGSPQRMLLQAEREIVGWQR